MSSKGMKALILSLCIVVLLVVAGVTSTKVGDRTEPNAAPTAAPTDGATEVQPTQETEPVSVQNGWTDVNGKSVYYLNGVLQQNTVVGTEAEGFYYVGSDGACDYGYCDALNIDGTKWNVIEGKASRVNDEWDECLHSALYHVGKCTNSSMTRDEKLYAAFKYLQDDNNFLEGVLHDPPYNEMDWPVVCANDLFVEGMGDCFSYGAAYAFMAKGIGCENCYACNTGGHGWAEIDGKAYDPEFDMHNHEYSHYAVAPEDDNNVAYFTSITEGVDWMYIKL